MWCVQTIRYHINSMNISQRFTIYTRVVWVCNFWRNFLFGSFLHPFIIWFDVFLFFLLLNNTIPLGPQNKQLFQRLLFSFGTDLLPLSHFFRLDIGNSYGRNMVELITQRMNFCHVCLTTFFGWLERLVSIVQVRPLQNTLFNQ